MKFTMAGRLSECLLLAYRAPADGVRHLVPRGLRLVTRGDWAFWNIVACRVERMRPAGAPRLFGISYYHVAYRLYAQATTADGQEVEGLYFVRSDADSVLIAQAGNIASDFRFHRADISMMASGNALSLDVKNSEGGVGGAWLRANLSENSGLAADSCFASTDEAAAFLKYRPLGLSCDESGRRLKIAEVFRDESQWQENVIQITDARWAFFDHYKQRDARLELATRVAPIDYRWRLGRSLPLL